MQQTLKDVCLPIWRDMVYDETKEDDAKLIIYENKVYIASKEMDIEDDWYYLHDYVSNRKITCFDIGCQDCDLSCGRYHLVDEETRLCKQCFKNITRNSKVLYQRGVNVNNYYGDIYYTTSRTDNLEGVVNRLYLKLNFAFDMNNLPGFISGINKCRNVKNEYHQELLYNFVKQYTIDNMSIFLFLIRELSQDRGLVDDINIGWYWFNALYSL